MRNTIIIGSVLALIGFASAAQASDWHRTSDQSAARVHREASDDSRGERHDRYERKGRHHGEAGERHRESREMHRKSHERREHR
jgi:hypothetical protein